MQDDEPVKLYTIFKTVTQRPTALQQFITHSRTVDNMWKWIEEDPEPGS